MGIENVSDAVLVAVILRAGVPGVNVVDLANALIRRYGSLSAMAAASSAEIAQMRGVGPVKAQMLKAALEIGRRLHLEAVPKRFRIRSPEDVARLLQDEARVLDQEQFWVLHLDAKNALRQHPVKVTRGLVDASLVHPREVFRSAVGTATAAVVLAHNHPSGDTTPSAEDIKITRQLVSAGRILDIRVLDHVVVGRGREDGRHVYTSFRESGIVDFS